MEANTATSNNISTNKTGIKTIDHISEIPVVTAALNNVTDYYSKVKETNSLFRTSLNLAELSVRTMAWTATPITSLCKTPINMVDTYLCDKVQDLEHTYPTIAKPTDQISAQLNSQAKLIYNRTVQEPIDLLNNIKDRTINYGTNTVQAVVQKGINSVDSVLENNFAKMLTNPVLDFTERSLNYWLPIPPLTGSDLAESGEQQRTLRRIYDINNRLYRGVHQATFAQLNYIHEQFENTIRRLQTLKDLSDSVYNGSRDRLTQTLDTVSKNTLVAQCMSMIDTKNLSIEKLDTLTRSYSRAILNDVSQMIESYLNLVRNFPVVFNGTRLRKIVDDLRAQMNSGSFAVYLTTALDQIKSINQALLTYTNQMLHVVNDNRLVQLLKRTSSQLHLKANNNNCQTEQPPQRQQDQRSQQPPQTQPRQPQADLLLTATKSSESAAAAAATSETKQQVNQQKQPQQQQQQQQQTKPLNQETSNTTSTTITTTNLLPTSTSNHSSGSRDTSNSHTTPYFTPYTTPSLNNTHENIYSIDQQSSSEDLSHKAAASTCVGNGKIPTTAAADLSNLNEKLARKLSNVHNNHKRNDEEDEDEEEVSEDETNVRRVVYDDEEDETAELDDDDEDDEDDEENQSAENNTIFEANQGTTGEDEERSFLDNSVEVSSSADNSHNQSQRSDTSNE